MYTEKLRRRGIDIYRGHELNILRSLKTAEILDDDFDTVDEARPLGDLLDMMAREPRAAYYVVDGDGGFVGAIRQPDLQSLLLQADALAPVVVARDLVREQIHTLRPDDRLDSVMRIFAERQPDELPVLDPDSEAIRGVVSRRQMIEAYNRELMKRDMAAGLGGRLDAARSTEMPVGEDHVLLEVDAPAGFVGLQQLAVRPRYGVQILLVRRRDPDTGESRELVPEGSTRIRAGDRLVLLGPERATSRFRG